MVISEKKRRFLGALFKKKLGKKKSLKSGAILAPKSTLPGNWSVVGGEWRVAKVGFLKTGKGIDDYETAVRWYLPKTASELREGRRRNSKSYKGKGKK